MLERSQSLLQYYNNIASLQDWYSTDHGSHTPLQDDGSSRRLAGDGAGDGAAAQKQTIVNVGREHRDGCAKLSETNERWTSLAFLTMIMTGEERRREAKQWQDAALNFVNTA